MRKMISAFLVVLVISPVSQQIWALSVSDVELKSSLNQQLEAQILFLVVDQDELRSLQISINNIAENSVNQRSINFMHELKENENGHYISITSQDVIREPVLSFSLELNWSKGRLIREYSLLIDPRW